ncbi:MAG: transglycosylase SLT domain-containing protein [Elusimicrobia bacterium]|nr:transglycosylase SLT domain-containing protein [Elusimicrobiota bacterium]
MTCRGLLGVCWVSLGSVGLWAEEPVVTDSVAVLAEDAPVLISTSPVEVESMGLNPTVGSDANAPDRNEPSPPWLIKSEKYFERGLAAESSGDLRSARRHYARALKVYLDGADDAAVVDMKTTIATVLNVAESQGLSESDLQEKEIGGLESMTGAQIKSVDAERVHPVGSTRTYVIHIDAQDPLVKKYVALYAGPLRERTQAAFDRMGKYMDMVSRTILEERMPRELIYLPVVESEYHLFAVSKAGAVGLWQFMPSTAKYAGLKVNYWVDERRDPDKSTRAAMKTLKSLYDWFDDWHLALAAYNRGMYGIQRDLEFTRSTDFTLLSKRQGIPLETEQYVPKLMALVLIGDNAAEYGFRPPRVSSVAPPDTVVLNRPLDLKVAAACAGVSESVIRELNPSVRLWVTPSNEASFAFKVPAGSKDRFLAALAQVKDWNPSPGHVRYTVQKGDILGRIAARFRTTPAAIQRENKLASAHRLRPGQVLVIRPGRGFKGE